MKKNLQKILFGILGVSMLAGGGFSVYAQAPTVPQKAKDLVEKRIEEVNHVYDSIFASEKQDPKMVEFGSEQANGIPVALTRLQNGKIAYLVDGKPFYPRGVETGWWDVRVDDNGTSVGDSGNVGEHFKPISSEEWTYYFNDMHQMGFNTVQLMIYWKDWQPDNPFLPDAPQGEDKYDWTFLDEVTELAAQAGLKTELVIFFHSQTDNIPKEMDQFWAYQFDTFEDNQGKWSMAMQWGFDAAKGKMASAEDARKMRNEGKGWGVENFLEYWHPDIYKEMTQALTALGNHFKDSNHVIGYQIGNEEGFNPNVDSGRDHNPYYTKMKERWMRENSGKSETEFRAELVNHLWASFTNALRKGDPYKPTTTNIQSSAMEEAGWGLPGKPIAGNDGTQMNYYRSVDMVGPMFYGNGENKLNHLDQAFNQNGQGFATGFPLLFPSEIGAYHQGGAVAKQISAMTAARGGVGMGFYCYGELYYEFEEKGTELPKPERAQQVALQSTLKDCEKMLWEGLPVTKEQAAGLFMEMKDITVSTGKPTLSVLQSLDENIMGILHFPGNSGNPNDKQMRDVTVTLHIPQAGQYKITIHQTDGTVSVQYLTAADNQQTADFVFQTSGTQASYIVAEKTSQAQPEQAVLEGIQIIAPPSKRVYKIGEEFSSEGLLVNAQYSDGTKVAIPFEKLLIEGFDSSSAGKKEITVSYTEKDKTVNATFMVTVQKPQQDTNMVLYEQGSLSRLFDGRIEDGRQVDIRANEEDKQKMAAKEYYIEYGFEEMVALKGVDFWTNYGTGQGVTKFQVAVPSSDGESWQMVQNEPVDLTWQNNTASFEKQGTAFEPVKTDRVRIYILDAATQWEHPNFGSKFALFEIAFDYDVIPLESIEITKLPNQLEYTLFGTLNPEGIQVFANYQDGSKLDITNEVAFSPLEALTPGTKTITVTYKDKSTTFDVQVIVTLAGISVTPPDKTIYQIGESFDPAGMVVTASYDYGSTKDVTQQVQMTGFDSQTSGEKIITVSYEGKTAQFKIFVQDPQESIHNPVKIEVKAPIKTVYQVGEMLDTKGMQVFAFYQDGSKEDVTSKVQMEGFDSQTIGEKVITVRYGALSAQFKVEITDRSDQPVIIQGANAVWTGSAEGLTVKSNADFDAFVEVRVDGTVVSSDAYIVRKGSTVVTLKPEYLKTLSKGAHSIEIVSKTGIAKTAFEVKQSEQQIPAPPSSKPQNSTPAAAPQTGDTSKITAYVSLMIVSLLGIGAILYERKKVKK